MDPNAKCWNDRAIAKAYGEASYLFPGEMAVFAHAWPLIQGRRVLDVAVGGGRTVPFLRGPAAEYVAIDYAPEMVQQCRERFPGLDVRVGDARDLGHLPTGYFDFVLLSFNAIDYVAPEERATVLSAIRRVLAAGGMFAFSSHNLRTAPALPSRFSPPNLKVSANPLRLAVRVGRLAKRTVVGYVNHRRLQMLERQGDGFVVVNDGAHDYSVVTCYVDVKRQIDELESAGFSDIRVFGDAGQPISPSASNDMYPYFLARNGGQIVASA